MHDIEQIRRAALNPGDGASQPYNGWIQQGVQRGDATVYQPFHAETGALGPVYATGAQALAATIAYQANNHWVPDLAFGPLEPAPTTLPDGRPNPGI